MEKQKQVHKVDCIDISPIINCCGDIHDCICVPAVPKGWDNYTTAWLSFMSKHRNDPHGKRRGNCGRAITRTQRATIQLRATMSSQPSIPTLQHIS